MMKYIAGCVSGALIVGVLAGFALLCIEVLKMLIITLTPLGVLIAALMLIGGIIGAAMMLDGKGGQS